MFKFRMWPVLATGLLVLCAGPYAIADDDDDDDDDRVSRWWGQFYGDDDDDDDDDDNDSSVEGRTYCSVLTQLQMRGSATNPFLAQLRHRIVRRTATFSGGVIDAKTLSRVQNTQDNNGAVTHVSAPGMDTLGSYIQTGNKLDITFPDFGVASSRSRRPA